MSRVGKLPVPVPKGVEVNVAAASVSVKGPLGTLVQPVTSNVVLDLAPGAASRAALLDPAGAISDPVGGAADQYRACAEHIEQALDARLEEFLHEDLDW